MLFLHACFFCCLCLRVSVPARILDVSYVGYHALVRVRAGSRALTDPHRHEAGMAQQLEQLVHCTKPHKTKDSAVQTDGLFLLGSQEDLLRLLLSGAGAARLIGSVRADLTKQEEQVGNTDIKAALGLLIAVCINHV